MLGSMGPTECSRAWARLYRAALPPLPLCCRRVAAVVELAVAQEMGGLPCGVGRHHQATVAGADHAMVGQTRQARLSQGHGAVRGIVDGPSKLPSPCGTEPAIRPTSALPCQSGRPSSSRSLLRPNARPQPCSDNERAVPLPRSGEPRQTTRCTSSCGWRRKASSASNPPGCVRPATTGRHRSAAPAAAARPRRDHRIPRNSRTRAPGNHVRAGARPAARPRHGRSRCHAAAIRGVMQTAWRSAGRERTVIEHARAASGGERQAARGVRRRMNSRSWVSPTGNRYSPAFSNP